MFEGFVTEMVEVGDVRLHVRHAGTGPAIVLLHGHPRTSSTWHRVAPALVARGFRVVCPDLRGYGRSSKPTTTADHAPYSKSVMADDVRLLMRLLGEKRFTPVGHDRGAYVAFRLAMEHSDAVERVALLDALPIVEHLERCDARFALQWWHWFFFAQPDKPERAILSDPDAWYGGDPAVMGTENHEEYRQAINDPATVHAMLEDYRAGLTVDRAADEADRKAGRQITCPTMVLWSTHDDLEDLHGDPLPIWRPWAPDLRGHAIDSGHHMAEESPNALVDELLRFMSVSERRSATP